MGKDCENVEEPWEQIVSENVEEPWEKIVCEKAGDNVGIGCL